MFASYDRSVGALQAQTPEDQDLAGADDENAYLSALALLGLSDSEDEEEDAAAVAEAGQFELEAKKVQAKATEDTSMEIGGPPKTENEQTATHEQGDSDAGHSKGGPETDALRLEEMIKSVLVDLLPSQEKTRQQDGLVKRLLVLFQNIYPGARLDVFGSTVCEHAGQSSDIDVTFSPAFSHRLVLGEKKKVISTLALALRRIGVDAQPILNARVPIARIFCRASAVAVDLSVENELPVWKSRLLHEYTLLDARFPHLVLLVKAWAKMRKIGSAQHGTFNSFGLSLLCLHFLQNLDPPVLPFLNQQYQGANRAPLCEDGPRLLGDCYGDCGNRIEIRHYTQSELRSWRSDNSSSLAMLAKGFFCYFVRFNWDLHVVSVTRQGLVPKSSVKVRSANKDMVIQDPLDEHDNVARNITRKNKTNIIHEFERALDFEALLLELRPSSIYGATSLLAQQRPGGQQRAEDSNATGGPEKELTAEEARLALAAASRADKTHLDTLPRCGTPGEVLHILGVLSVTASMTVSTMAMAIHSIARTCHANTLVLLKSHCRFQFLITCIAQKLKQAPEQFDEMHLTQVVYGAARLAVLNESIFFGAQQEILSPRRQLGRFSPEQLASITWAYRTVNYNAPQLFQALQLEAMRRPPLAQLLGHSVARQPGVVATAAFANSAAAGQGALHRLPPHTLALSQSASPLGGLLATPPQSGPGGHRMR